MQVRLVRRHRSIAPFGVEVDACGLGAGTFGSYRDGILAHAGLAATDAGLDEEVAGPALVWSDDVWVSLRALRTFLQAARAATSVVRLCLPPSRQTELFLPLQDVAVDAAGRSGYEVAWIPAGTRTTPRAAFALPADAWLAVPYKELNLQVPAPRYILRRETATMPFPLTSTVVMRIRHWLHVLRAGHLIPQVTLLERAMREPVRSLGRALLSARATHASRLRALRKNFAYHGKGCFVHPTATVEASVLGDNVHIGAYSYVTNSVIGDGTVIEQRAHVSGCALGPRTFVSLNSSLQACVTFGDTDACINGVQACVIAERCALTSFARPLDLAVEGPVRVEDEGVLREVGELPCGVAFGPGVFAGADVVIAAGRAIPAGVRLYVNGSGVLQKVPATLQPGSYAVVDGKPLM